MTLDSRFAAALWLAGVCGCRAAPSDIALNAAASPADAGPGCVEGFVLSSRYLGPAFALQAHVVSVREVNTLALPPGNSASLAVLWTLESPNTGAGYVIRNADVPGWSLSQFGSMVDDDHGEPDAWRVEAALPGLQSDEPLFVFRPEAARSTSLATHFAPPYYATTAPGDGEAVQHWRLSPRVYCPDPVVPLGRDAGS